MIDEIVHLGLVYLGFASCQCISWCNELNFKDLLPAMAGGYLAMRISVWLSSQGNPLGGPCYFRKLDT
jgi:hypothetical protein